MSPRDAAERLRLLADLSVLFVDDDAMTRSHARGLLEGRVRTLRMAAGGRDGLFSYASNRPDVVVLDVDMPDMSGLDLAAAIRDIGPDVPIVLLTHLDDPAVFRRAIALRVVDFLPKPLELPDMLDALARAAGALMYERELNRQVRLNALMLDAAPSPSILADLRRGRVVAANRPAVVLGYDVDARIDSGPLLPPDLLKALRDGEGREPPAGEPSREVEADGRHWLLYWAAVSADAVLFTAVDITPRVEMERFRDDMERIARHDLKSPLTALVSLPELLLMDDNLTGEQRELIRNIHDAGERMLDMINLSLDLFKMEAGAYRPPEERFDLALLTRRAARALAGVAGSLGVSIAAGGLPETPALARGDENLCRSMLDNLLKNAIEASPPGGTVRLTMENGSALRLRITNPGEVPKDIRARFFEKYATSGKIGGTGLGTYSARMVARAHGGDVLLLADRPGETEVDVLLPASSPLDTPLSLA